MGLDFVHEYNKLFVSPEGGINSNTAQMINTSSRQNIMGRSRIIILYGLSWYAPLHIHQRALGS